jgi:hypothetical protein
VANKALFVIFLTLSVANKALFVIFLTLSVANKALFVVLLTLSVANKASFVALLTFFGGKKAPVGELLLSTLRTHASRTLTLSSSSGERRQASGSDLAATSRSLTKRLGALQRSRYTFFPK